MVFLVTFHGSVLYCSLLPHATNMLLFKERYVIHLILHLLATSCRAVFQALIVLATKLCTISIFQVQNPFEENEIIGITNYLDFGFELKTR